MVFTNGLESAHQQKLLGDIDERELTFFKELRLGTVTTILASSAKEKTYRIDMSKTALSSLWMYEYSTGNKHSHMLGRIVAFFVPTHECQGREGDFKGPMMKTFKGPKCWVLVKRYPEHLFGGLYICDSSGVSDASSKNKGPLSKLEDEYAKEVPNRLVAHFVDEEGTGKADRPLTLHGDGWFPEVVVKPLNRAHLLPNRGSSSNAAAQGRTKEGDIVVDWTKDKDWASKDIKKRCDPIIIEQYLEQCKPNGTWERIGEAKYANDKKGDPKVGFTFGGRGEGLPEPGDYKLVYRMQPLRDEYEKSTKKQEEKTGLRTELYMRIQPALPRSFVAQPASSEPISLGVKTAIKVNFTGANDKEVKLSNDVRKEYQIMVEMCIRGLVALPGFVEQFPGLSEEQSITTLEKDFVVNVEIKVGKKKENSQVLGFIMNVTVMPSFDTKNEVSLTDELAALGPDGMVGEPRRPKSKFWKGDRTKPQEVTLRIELPGCRIMKGKDQYTYLEFPKGQLRSAAGARRAVGRTFGF